MNRHYVYMMGTGFVIMALSSLVACQSMQLSSNPQVSDAQQVVMKWKAKPMQVAKQIMVKYGPPDEVTAERLIWHDKGPWKFIEIVNEEIPHSFPKPHTDMLYQSINYRVPPDFFDELAFYDGSIIAERTKGELGARCDMEEANFLAINLANEIVHGKKTVTEAREFYAEAMRDMKHPEYKQGLLFDVASRNQGDRDEEVFAATEKQ